MPGFHHRNSLFEDFTGLSIPKTMLVTVSAFALIALALWAGVQFLDPLPPRRIVLATGPEGSALHALGRRYAERLAKGGIEVQLRATRGAADNLELLADPKGEVTAGFIAAGMASPEQAARLVNVSNLSPVPLLCVARSSSADITLAEMKGLRLAIGARGTGLNAWLTPLLALNGLTPDNTRFLELSASDAARGFANGEVDVVFHGEGAGDAGFAELLTVPGARLMSFPRADAYARRFPHIVTLSLPAGTLDFARGVPERDLALIGTTLMIVAGTDLHPTVVDLLVDAARDLHTGQGLFQKRGEFPHLHMVDAVPVSAQAVQHAREGPSLLRRYLPLWAADALQRGVILAVPLLAVAFPLVRRMPAILGLLAQWELLLGYAKLRRIERRLRERATGERVDDLLQELHGIAEKAAGIKESVFKAGELYSFRIHLNLVRDAVAARTSAAPDERRAVVNGAGTRDIVSSH
jgi:TRAP-type uncharacterized transport system substrate-binding protein